MLVLNPCFSTTAAGLASLRLGHKCEAFGTNLSKLADELSEVNTHGIVSGFTNAYLTAIKGVVDSFIKQLCVPFQNWPYASQAADQNPGDL